jgi:hypothetical protein
MHRYWFKEGERSGCLRGQVRKTLGEAAQDAGRWTFSMQHVRAGGDDVGDDQSLTPGAFYRVRLPLRPEGSNDLKV